MRVVRGIEAWDGWVLRWINRDAAASWMDPVARLLTGHPLFYPTLACVALAMLWVGGVKGRVFVVVLGLAAVMANEGVVRPMKLGFGRSRPYVDHADVVLRVGRGNPHGSMPSGHAMNAALMATVAWWYYRRAGWVLALVAVGVGWSRVYNGVHHPSDVLVGWLVGVGVGVLVILGLDWVWRRWVLGVRPSWVRFCPSILRPVVPLGVGGEPAGGGALR